jgi:hypothetical protein
LALSRHQTPRGESWATAENVTSLRIADFACGTGTLLSTVYHSIRQLHEFHGGDEAALHPTMMSDVLLGCDIMPAAVHITASMLSGAHPSVKYTNSSIIMMPYGKQDNDAISLGSVDLLKTQGTFPVLATHAVAISGDGAKVQDTWKTIPDAQFDLVVMNPPFVRPTNHEGKRAGVPNPMFAAFGSTEEEQEAMSKQMKKVAGKTAYHGNAGEASAFLALGDRKLADKGQIALVMPLSLQMGEGWAKARSLLQRTYQDLCVVNIAAETDVEASFSADTGMAECLVVGRKTGQPSARALFVTLSASPSTALEGAAVARRIRDQWHGDGIRRLEDGPVGGTGLRVGDDLVGTMIDAPLFADEPWQVSRVSDLSLAQAAYQLTARNRLWQPGMEEAEALAMPMCRLGELADVGPLHRDINGIEGRGLVIRGPFEIVELSGTQEPTYPALWNHEASAERQIVAAPDKQGVVRQGRTPEEDTAIRSRAGRIWRSASKCHLNRDFRYNSQSTAFCYTERAAIGGRAWPSLTFRSLSHDKAFLLWANSTLGLICHWWQANKQQSGRGSITLTKLPKFRVYDFRQLTDGQLSDAASIFDEFKTRQMQPFHELDTDPVRHDLDRAVLVDVLRLDQSLVAEDGPIALLRRKLAREPSIRGGKKTKARAVLDAID